MRKRSATAEKPASAQPKQEARPASAFASSAPASNGSIVFPEEIRVRAYQKWEAAGRPGGDGVPFWLEAERELLEVR
jgi:hypothetical protein